MLYRFDGKGSDKEYYEFNKYHLIESPEAKKTVLFRRLEIPAIFLIFCIYGIIRGYERDFLIYMTVIYGVFAVAWFFLLKPLMLLSIKSSIKRMKKRGSLPYTYDAILEFYDDYYVETTEDVKTEKKYSAIYKVRVNEGKAIYIYSNAVQADIISFDNFDTDEKRKEFIGFINAKASVDTAVKK